MLQWLQITIGVLLVVVLIPVLIVFLRRCCCYSEQPPSNAGIGVVQTRSESFQARIAKLHQLDTSDIKRRGNINSYYVLRRGSSGTGGGFQVKPGLFSWSDHPNLITDAVENGWSRFGFVCLAPLPPPPPPQSALLGFCAVAPSAGDCEESKTEITWEVSNGSVDFLQKIKFNRKLKKVNHNPYSVIRAALPLPGPQLGSSAFPQEAYFEITILGIDGGSEGGDDVASVEGEKTKLIKESSDCLNKKEAKIVMSSKDCDGKREEVLLCVGLTTNIGSGSDSIKLPGGFHGSIGFNSNGSIYLDGFKLVFESVKHEWGKTDKVIGCGFDPRKKLVFFTVDSHLVHVINCKAGDFSTPLYPTMASNTEATVLVNLGQSPFSYGPANGQRTANPCFIGPLVRSSPAATAVGFEDSKELFSMGRIDSQYLNRFISRGNNEDNNSKNNNGSIGRKPEDDDQSDADLFEIVLESSGRLPNTRL